MISYIICHMLQYVINVDYFYSDPKEKQQHIFIGKRMGMAFEN